MLDLASRYVDVDALPWVNRCRIIIATGYEHADVEQTFVLEGSLVDHEGECKAGDFVWRPAGSRHRAWSPQGCLLLAVFLKPNTFLTDASAPPD